MKKNLLQFPNLHPLFYSATLSALLEDRDGRYIHEQIRGWNISGIRSIILFEERERSASFLRLIDFLRSKGFSIVVITERVTANDLPYSEHVNQYVADIMRKSPLLFLYSESHSRESEIFLKRLEYQLHPQSETTNGHLPELNQFIEYISLKSGGAPKSSLPSPPPAKEKSPAAPGEERVAPPTPERARPAQEPRVEAETAKPLVEAEQNHKGPETAKNGAEKKAAKKDSPVQPTPSQTGTDFRPSRFTIRVKLMAIISSIVLTSLSIMIYLASYFFKTSSERMIQDNNLNLTEVIGQKIEIELESISQDIRIFASNIFRDEGMSRKKIDQFAELYFRNNHEIIFIGIAENAQGAPSYLHSFYNDDYLIQNKITRTEMEGAVAQNTPNFTRSFGGATIIYNASPGFKMPILAISTPYQDKIVTAFLDPGNFLKTFQTTGITKTYMVNETGEVIAHPESKFVMTKLDLSKLPIIKKMKESKIDNGQISFEDESKISYLGSFRKLNISGLGIISTVETERAFEEVYNIQRRNLYIMVLILNASLLIVFFYAKGLTTPIKSLVKATKDVETGNYGIRIRPSARDEVGLLTNSFVNMAKGLSERERMKDAFGRFVNKEIAEMVLQGELKLGGERKDAAIFFSDLRGFTAMSEGMEPEEVVEYLNKYFTKMVGCVNDTHGIVDKFIGDAIMAHWGALQTHGNNTENAINAALMMRRGLIEFNADADDVKKPFAKFGCGINTGPVIAGQIGSEERLEFTVIGDAVNLASRIESLNKPFGTDILISHDSYEIVRDIYRVEKMPAIKVKGKSEAQTIYCVLGRFDDPNCIQSLDELRRQARIDYHGTDKKGEFLDEEKEVKYEIIEG